MLFIFLPVRLQREPLRAGLQPDLRVREQGAVRATQRPLQLPARLDRSVLPGRCGNRFHTRPRPAARAAETFPADSGETGVNKAAQVLTVRKCDRLDFAGARRRTFTAASPGCFPVKPRDKRWPHSRLAVSPQVSLRVWTAAAGPTRSRRTPYSGSRRGGDPRGGGTRCKTQRDSAGAWGLRWLKDLHGNRLRCRFRSGPEVDESCVWVFFGFWTCVPKLEELKASPVHWDHLKVSEHFSYFPGSKQSGKRLRLSFFELVPSFVVNILPNTVYKSIFFFFFK